MNTNQAFQTIWNYKLRFVAVFFLIFTATYAVLYIIDFLPEPVTEPAEPAVDLESAANQALNIQIIETETIVEPAEPEPVSAVLPTGIYIEKLDKTVTVLNPDSRAIADLDQALLDGVVRHPDSATLNQEGNVFILGHSSYLPNVLNKNFQAFNGIQNLEWGDTIEVLGGGKTYVYRVEKVYKAKASDVTVPIADTGSMLTIATCNSFGSTDDRYIVEASLLKTVSA